MILDSLHVNPDYESRGGGGGGAREWYNEKKQANMEISRKLCNFHLPPFDSTEFLFSLPSLFVNGDDFVRGAEGSVSKRIYRQQRISKEGGFDRRVRLTLYRKLSFSFIMRGELFSRKSIELRR